MSEATTNPNLKIPVSLWGEVKVAAFRRGCRPVELVIECLREKYTESPKKAGREPSVRSYEAKKVEVAGGWSEPPKTPPVVTPAPKIGVPVEYVEGGVILEKCSKCGDKVQVSKLMAHPKFPNKKFCGDCVENMKNNQ